MKTIILLLLLFAVEAEAQYDAIQHFDYAYTSGGLAAGAIYSPANNASVDSAWNVLVSGGTLNGVRVCYAYKFGYGSISTLALGPCGETRVISRYKDAPDVRSRYDAIHTITGADAGTSGQFLSSNGLNAAPSWNKTSQLLFGFTLNFNANADTNTTGDAGPLVGLPNGFNYTFTGHPPSPLFYNVTSLPAGTLSNWTVVADTLDNLDFDTLTLYQAHQYGAYHGPWHKTAFRVPLGNGTSSAPTFAMDSTHTVTVLNGDWFYIIPSHGSTNDAVLSYRSIITFTPQ